MLARLERIDELERRLLASSGARARGGAVGRRRGEPRRRAPRDRRDCARARPRQAGRARGAAVGRRGRRVACSGVFPVGAPKASATGAVKERGTMARKKALHMGLTRLLPRPNTRASASKGPELAQVIAFANQKGGVAKTTTTLNLAVAFEEQG